MGRPRNLVVAQSGGPSCVINSSLRGIVETSRESAKIGTVYGGHHGIEGVLKEELIDLSAQSAEEIALLRFTPAAGSIGTCRYKLKDWQNEDFDRVIEVFQAHDVGYFLYIGGNDSMDTANKVAALAGERGLDLVGVGVPKTIDNDVGDSEFKLIDHTPGYGSCAKYWMHMVQNANEENAGSCPADPVLVLQAMGRKIGFIPAAARLADPDRVVPLQIYLAERKVTLEQIADQVNDQLKSDGRCILVVSEGLDVGDLGEVKDSFGHTSFGSSQITVARIIVNYLNAKGLNAKGLNAKGLNAKGLAARGAARCNVAGTDQRSAIAYASSVDLDEAYQAGAMAVKLAAADQSGFMSTILRNAGPVYGVTFDKVPLAEVANSERTFPEHWISANGVDVTDDFVDYCRPLVGEDMVSLPMIEGRQRLARIEPIYVQQKLDSYVPQANRSKSPAKHE